MPSSFSSALHPVDKNQVSRQFSRAASNYDSSALLQQKMSEQLIRLIEKQSVFDEVDAIADLGCGTGYSLEVLSRRYPKKIYKGIDLSNSMLEIAQARVPQADLIYGDIEFCALPKAIDLFFSNASVQWCNFERVVENISSVIPPKGLFAFSSFAPKTHQEIHQAWQRVDKHSHRIGFLSLEEHIEILKHQGFEILSHEIELHQLPYDSPTSLLQSIKKTGATNATVNRTKGLLSRKKYQSFISELAQLTPLALTYDVIYIVAKYRA